MSAPRYVGAGHLDVALRDEITAANLQSLVAREKARDKRNLAPPPEPVKPVLKAVPAPPAKAEAPASKPRSTPPVTKTRPPHPPPGYVLMTPKEADIVRRMIETHPDMQR
jgi:hypothetical protein